MKWRGIMKKIYFIIILSLIMVGCSPKKEMSETKAYFKEAWDYVNDLNRFAKRTSEIIADKNNEGSKMDEIKKETEKMKKRAEEFNDYNHPKALKHIHRQLMSQNYLLIDSLGLVVASIEAGETSVEKISGLIDKAKANEMVQSFSAIIKKSE